MFAEPNAKSSWFGFNLYNLFFSANPFEIDIASVNAIIEIVKAIGDKFFMTTQSNFGNLIEGRPWGISPMIATPSRFLLKK